MWQVRAAHDCDFLMNQPLILAGPARRVRINLSAVEVGAGAGAVLGLGEQPVFAADGERPDGVFDGLVVDRVTTVVEVAHQSRPLGVHLCQDRCPWLSKRAALRVLWVNSVARLCIPSRHPFQAARIR